MHSCGLNRATEIASDYCYFPCTAADCFRTADQDSSSRDRPGSDCSRGVCEIGETKKLEKAKTGKKNTSNWDWHFAETLYPLNQLASNLTVEAG